MSSSRRPGCQETYEESVVGAQRGSWTSEDASKGFLGRREPGPKGVLRSKGPARTVSVSSGPPREPLCPEASENPENS